MQANTLKIQYSEIALRSERMRAAIVDQLLRLIDDSDVTLGVPMESRVKEWSSIEEKIERKNLNVEDLKSLPDIIGIRTILLFRPDLDRVNTLIHETFDVVSAEDTANRLDETQFGYQSLHYIVKVPKSWLAVPSMADFGDLQAEIQVRTLAQHIWAATSHKLQYKDEASVPPPVRRAINRASALLETVDLEFERVLQKRETYRDVEIPAKSGSDPLNVDLLSAVLAEILPEKNLSNDEPYERLLRNLGTFSINSVDDLRNLLEKHLDAILSSDKEEVQLVSASEDYVGTTKDRNDIGVFWTHVGLARKALSFEFGYEDVRKVIMGQS